MGFEQMTCDYNSCFKAIYYRLYSNSNASRAERIISDITKILLYKMLQENGSVASSENVTGETVLRVLKKHYTQGIDQFESFSLSDQDIQWVLDMLNNISLTTAPAHIIGDAFQAIIGPTIRGDKGQFFTPRELVDCMVNIISPGINDLIIDPACGTGGFLTQAFSYIKDNVDECSSFQLVGIDKDKDMANMSLAVTEIITKGRAAIYNANSLEIIFPDNYLHKYLGKADIVLTNPPFGAKIGITDKKILANYDFGHMWSYSEKDNSWYMLNTIAKNQAPQVLFLELCIRLLKLKGKLAIVLPEGLFGNKSLGYIWAYLKKQGKILGMIDCPRSTFQPSTDTKTNVLLFEKGQEYSSLIPVAVAKHCGHDKRGRIKTATNELITNDYADIAQDFHESPDNSIWWKRAKVEGNYFVPRYLSQRVNYSNDENSISIGEMLEGGMLIKKKGKEIGSEAYGTGDIPYVRTSDLINYEISSDPTNAVSEEIYEKFAAQQNLEVGDILFVADGRYRIGKAAIITEYNIKCLIQSHIEILSLTTSAPFTPFEFLYCLGMEDVQEQIRSMIFIQSTLGTLGNRIKEIRLQRPARTKEWNKTIESFQNNIETRAKCLYQLKQAEHFYEL